MQHAQRVRSHIGRPSAPALEKADERFPSIMALALAWGEP